MVQQSCIEGFSGAITQVYELQPVSGNGVRIIGNSWNEFGDGSKMRGVGFFSVFASMIYTPVCLERKFLSVINDMHGYSEMLPFLLVDESGYFMSLALRRDFINLQPRDSDTVFRSRDFGSNNSDWADHSSFPESAW